MIAEESTAWPLVTRPPDVGGLGFNLKWNMGWMNDMCHYLKLDPYFRQYQPQGHHLLHDVRLFGELCPAHLPRRGGPHEGFRGGEDARRLRQPAALPAGASTPTCWPIRARSCSSWARSWASGTSGTPTGQLDWYLLDNEETTRRSTSSSRTTTPSTSATAALWEIDFDWEGFEWLVPDDNHNNVVVFLRKDKKGRDLMCAVNFSPNTYENYRMGVPPSPAVCARVQHR